MYVTVLALCAGLVQLRLTHCGLYLHTYTENTGKATSYCDYLSLWVESDAGTVYLSNDHCPDENHVSITYGQSISVRCDGDNVKRLTMTQDGTKLETAIMYDHQIEWNIEKPGTMKSKYVCTDYGTNCEQEASISVKPAMSVSDYDDFNDINKTYVIQYGSSVTVFCSGPADARLIMTKGREKLETVHVSVKVDEVRIEWFEKKPDLQISKYECTDVGANTSNSVNLRVKLLTYVQIQNETLKRDYDHSNYYHSNTMKPMYQLNYGDTIEVFCTGPRPVKLSSVSEIHKEILTEKINETTVRSLITVSKIGESSIDCVDTDIIEGFHYMSTVDLMVNPRVEVLSPKIRQVRGEYYMKYYDPLEIVCSGPDATQLTINKNYMIEPNEISYTIVNKTAIKWYVKHFTDIFTHCVCYERDREPAIYVFVLPLPMASSFRCVSYNLQYLRCSWTSSLGYLINYTLSHIETGNSVHICTQLDSWIEEFCVWNYRSDIKVFNFLMESCSESVGCFNQTFVIDHASIVKPAPPKSLARYNSKPGYVMLTWSGTSMTCAGEHLTSYKGNFQYKVEYWHSGTEPVQANSSLVSFRYLYSYVELKLPCPDQFYTFRVYQKLKEAVGKEYWSDPVSVTFHSSFESVDNVDSTCDSGPEETKEVMTYFTQKLNNDVRLEKRKLKNKLMSLKDKRAQIRREQGKIDEL